MKKEITFRMVAYTDAAGKYTDGACRNGNEDNFYVDDNLADDDPAHCSPDEVTQLSKYGMLMAVADGMGGMNAGEVASQIATDTVKKYFYPGKLNSEIVSSPQKRGKYLEEVIKAADRNIKADAKQNPEHEGMGSTIVLAWMLGDELTISWCGDSRAYRFNPLNGIELLTSDHSYVQELVNKGILTYDQTFEHPQGNIVTRSLGEPGKEAKPETRQFKVYNGDIIMLCSDGLSGVLRDRKTYDENGNLLPGRTLEDIINDNSSSMKICRQALWDAAEQADWYDNVTVILCQIMDGASCAIRNSRLILPPEVERIDINGVNDTQASDSFWKKKIDIKLFIGAILFLLFVNVLAYFFLNRQSSEPIVGSEEQMNVESGSETDTILTTEDLQQREQEMGKLEKSKLLEQKGCESQTKGILEKKSSVSPKTDNEKESLEGKGGQMGEEQNTDDFNQKTESELTPIRGISTDLENRITPAQEYGGTKDSKGVKQHVVKAGETLFGIAKAEGVDVEDIKKENGLEDDKIEKGQILVIPQQKEK